MLLVPPPRPHRRRSAHLEASHSREASFLPSHCRQGRVLKLDPMGAGWVIGDEPLENSYLTMPGAVEHEQLVADEGCQCGMQPTSLRERTSGK
jgi:hypothetical protein